MFNKGRMCGMSTAASKVRDADVSVAHSNKIIEDMFSACFHQNLQQNQRLIINLNKKNPNLFTL
jgi:hypothetical protein